MERQFGSDGVELKIGPHSARRGWETVRLSYDMHNPRHQRQIEAVLAALRKSRLSPEGEPTPHLEQGANALGQGAGR